MTIAITPLVPSSPLPPDSILSHLAATATVHLLKALHYERFFGAPIAAFSAEHNAQRAEVNNRTVCHFAFEAGRFAFLSGATVDHWIAQYPEALRVERIRNAMGAGWNVAARVIDMDTLVGGAS